jgi:hypothetical protein
LTRFFCYGKKIVNPVVFDFIFCDRNIKNNTIKNMNKGREESHTLAFIGTQSYGIGNKEKVFAEV